MYKKVSVFVLLLILSPFGALPQNNNSAQEKKKTWKQKEHGKLFKYATGKNLRKLAADPSTPDVELSVGIAQYPGLWGLSSTSRPGYPHPYLVDLAQRVDAIVIGTAKECESALTEDEAFVFTDCQLGVEEILKANPRAPFGANTEITVTRQGGDLVLNGRPIRAKDHMFEGFEADSRYLLFLNYLPSTGSYIAFNTGSYRMAGQSIHSMTQSHWIDMKSRRNLAAFLEEVRAAVAARGGR